MNPGIYIFLIALAAFANGECRAAWAVDTEVGFVYDDNLSRAQLDSDIKSDVAMEGSLAVGRNFQLTDSSSVSVTVDVRGARYARFSGLDHTDLGLTVSSRTKFGMGAFAPWVSATGSVARLDYHSDIREGWLYAAGFGAGKRVSDRLELSAGYKFENRTSDHTAGVVPGISGAVFDQQNHIVSLRADTQVSKSTLVSLGYSRRSGDITSTTVPNFAIFKISSAIALDPAFGSGGVAYKLGATTHALNLGISHALNSRSSLNLAVERYASHGEGDINYYGNTVRAVYLYSF